MSSLRSGVIGVGLGLAAIASVAAQQPTRAPSPHTSTRSAPRTRSPAPAVHPDLQGIWVNNTATPFERPAELAGKEFLTAGELAVLKQRAARLFSGDGDHAPGDALFLALLRNPEAYRSPKATGSDYNQFWLDDGLEFEARTSQVIDPRDGHLPPLTPAGQQQQAADLERRNRVRLQHAQGGRRHPADGPCCHNLLPNTGPQTIEWNTDTSRALWSMINDGTATEPILSGATRFADIRFVWSHAGGSLLGLVGRFLGDAATAESLARTPEPNSRLYHLRRFYYDTAGSANPVQMQALRGSSGVRKSSSDQISPSSRSRMSCGTCKRAASPPRSFVASIDRTR